MALHRMLAMFDSKHSADWFYKTLSEGGYPVEMSYGDAVIIIGDKDFLDALADNRAVVRSVMTEYAEPEAVTEAAPVETQGTAASPG